MMAGIIWQQWWFAGKPISLNCPIQIQCRQLGFVWGIPTVSSHFGEVRPPVFSIDEIDCVGDEKHLQDCPHVNHDDCDSGDAAGGHAIYSTLTIISIQQVCFVATSPTLATILNYEAGRRASLEMCLQSVNRGSSDQSVMTAGTFTMLV